MALIPLLALLGGVIGGLVLGPLIQRRLQEEPLPEEEFPPVSPLLSLPRVEIMRWGHPLILGISALALALIFMPDAWPFALQAVFLLLLLYPLAWIDFYTLRIEAGLVLVGLLLRLALVIWLDPQFMPDAVMGALAGAGLLTLISFAYQSLRGRVGLGEGDPAVLALIGAFVGPQGLLPVLVLSAATGLVVGWPLLRLRGQSMHTPLPFAPFMCLAGMAVYLAQLLGWAWGFDV